MMRKSIRFNRTYITYTYINNRIVSIGQTVAYNYIRFQTNSLVWHKTSVNPGTHAHVNRFIPSWHVAPFWHGRLAHSLISAIETVVTGTGQCLLVCHFVHSTEFSLLENLNSLYIVYPEYLMKILENTYTYINYVNSCVGPTCFAVASRETRNARARVIMAEVFACRSVQTGLSG